MSTSTCPTSSLLLRPRRWLLPRMVQAACCSAVSPGQSSPDAETPEAAGAGLEPADAALARLTSQREQLGVRLVAMRSRLVASQQAWQQLSKQLQHESQQVVVLARVLVRRVDTATQMLRQLQQPPD